MRILQVTHRYPPQMGGVETHVKEISERLVKRGHEVTVFSADAREEGRRSEQRSGVNVRRFCGFAPNRAFYIAPGLISEIRQRDADVIHAHNYHSLPAFLASVSDGDRRFVFTTHYHGRSSSTIRNWLLSIYKPMGRWTIKQADELIAVSNWERERLQEDFNVEATVIPNGLQLDRFTDAEPLKQDRLYLLYVGRLVEYKGIQHVIRALTALPEYELLVAGSGPYASTLNRIAEEEGVEDRVDLLGYVEEEHLPTLYAGASVHLNLSEFESYGMTVAESLASGTPCVVRNAGGLQHWVAEEGVVGVNSFTQKDIADAIHKAKHSSVNTVIPDWSEIVDALTQKYSN